MDGLVFSEEVIYEMKCNWKVFYENVIDGYYFVYLYENIFGVLYLNVNIWVEYGQYLVWYLIECDGECYVFLIFVEDQLMKYWIKLFKEMLIDFGGVYMFFLMMIVMLNLYGVLIFELVFVVFGIMYFKVCSWVLKGCQGWFVGNVKSILGYDKKCGVVILDNWKKYLLEIFDFQIEDVWVCEKQQCVMEFFNFEICYLVVGLGVELMIGYFQ